MIRFLYPEKIIESKNVQTADNLFVKKTLQIGLNEKSVAVFQPHSEIVLDFGKEIRGGIRILTSVIRNNEYATVRIRFGESLSECYAELGEKNATNDHSPRDIRVCLSPWSDLCFGDTGFRFVKIEFLSDISVNIKSIVAKSYELNKKPVYVYDGDDELVNNIFQVAKRTVDLCSIGDYVYDGIKRDRLVWVGDMYPEMLALTALYGRFPAMERSLDFAKKQYSANEPMYGMPTYSLWWVLIVCDYYERTGAETYIARQLDYLSGILTAFDAKIDSCGKLDLPSYFVDWPTLGKTDEYIGAVFIAIAAYKKGIALLEKFGYDTASFKKTLSALMKNDFGIVEQKQVVGLKYFATGELSDDEYALLIDGGAKGFSTFMSYFILKAIASRDKTLAVELMKEYYGAMLNIGATTFFEDFDITCVDGSTSLDELPRNGQKDVHGDFGANCYLGFRHSLCHGWASGPTAWLSRHVLGVEFLEAGGKKIRIRPHLGDLKWVEGTYPTPYGEIHLRHEACADGSVKTTVQAPDAIEILDA